MLNKVQFIGHLGKDPEVRYLSSGTAVCNFSIASTEKWKDKDGEKHERTEWLKCNAFDRLAEVCGEWLKKGSLVYVEGNLQTREYEKDGTKRYVTECRVSQMKMLGGKPEGERQERAPASAPKSQAKAPASGTGFADMEDDIPF